MNRREFTTGITKLIQEMIDAGEQPVIDYVLRSAQEQKRLFDEGKSKCDGTIKLSNHQKGTAMDIYLCSYKAEGLGVSIDFKWNRTKTDKWHARWQKLGGKPMIEWDLPHFEG